MANDPDYASDPDYAQRELDRIYGDSSTDSGSSHYANDPDYARKELDKLKRMDLRSAGYETIGLGGRVPSAEPTGELQRFARQGRREGVIGAVKDFLSPQFSFTGDPFGSATATRKGPGHSKVSIRSGMDVPNDPSAEVEGWGNVGVKNFSVTRYDTRMGSEHPGRTTWHRTEDDAIITANRLLEGNLSYEDREKYD